MPKEKKFTQFKKKAEKKHADDGKSMDEYIVKRNQKARKRAGY